MPDRVTLPELEVPFWAQYAVDQWRSNADLPPCISDKIIYARLHGLPYDTAYQDILKAMKELVPGGVQ